MRCCGGVHRWELGALWVEFDRREVRRTLLPSAGVHQWGWWTFIWLGLSIEYAS